MMKGLKCRSMVDYLYSDIDREMNQDAASEIGV